LSAGFPSPAGDDLEDKIDPIRWVVRVIFFVVDGAFTAKILNERTRQYWLDPANARGG
jgi:DNA polymerase V